jgi:hypothetical protein
MPDADSHSNRTGHLLLIGLALGFSLFVLLIILAADRGLGPQLFGFVYWLPGGDLLGHFVLMGTLNLLVNLALGGRNVRMAGRPVLAGSLVLAVLLTAEEIWQHWIPTHTFSLADLAADYAALLLSSWLALRLLWRVGRSPRH